MGGAAALSATVRLASRGETAVRIVRGAVELSRRLFDKLVAAAYEHGKPLRAATTFELDDVIDPAHSRAWIARLRESRT